MTHLLAVLFTFLAIGSLTQTLVPAMDNLQNNPPQKYSTRHNDRVKAALQRKGEKIRVVTYNVLFDIFDNELKDSSYSWKERLPHILDSIRHIQPDILGVQETYPCQLRDLKASLPEYDCFCGHTTIGEINAIFYKKERFDVDMDQPLDLSNASLDLPLHPDDEAIVAKIPHMLPPTLEPGRQLTLLHLRDKLNGTHFAVMNTHLTYYRVNSREEQALFLADLTRKLHDQNIPVILTGDFNTFPNRPELKDVRFYDGTHICRILQAVLNDTKQAALLGHMGPLSSAIPEYLYVDHRHLLEKSDPEMMLDHIFVSPSITVLVNAVEACLSDGRYPSDHFPVIADILLPQ